VSKENVELVSRAMFPPGVDLVALTESGRLADALNVTVLAPDAEIAFVTPGVGTTEYRGLEGFLEGWGDWMVPWATYEVDVEELLDAGERVVVLVTLRGQTLHDHVEIEQPGAAVFSVAAGKIVRIEFHLDRREALEVAGLAE
jgi:ketosteroid isomerase-like protein